MRTSSLLKRYFSILSAVIFVVCLSAETLFAEVITDGSVGSALNIPGSNFVIPQSLGTTTGNNLFHSFQSFNIANTESATFTGANSIRNVISRVTGGQSSTIDGVLRSEIGQANFYFLNPAGVIFGPSASVNVPAAFHVSTAAGLQFSDGAVFSAIDPAASTLSMVNPSAFGFLARESAAIRITQSQLTFTPDTSTSISSGEIVIESGTLINEGGEIRLTSVGVVDVVLPLDSQLIESATGSIAIDNARIETSSDGAGRIIINGGQTGIVNSSVFADNNGSNTPQDNAGIEVLVQSLSVDNAFVTSDTVGSDDAGIVRVSVADTLNLVNSGTISSSTFGGGGNAGSVSVSARNVTINNQGAERLTGISSQANQDSIGNASPINVSVAESLTILNGGSITSSTFSTGNAGSVNVQANNININGLDSDFFTGIFSRADEDSSGNAGIVNVSVAETLDILNGGRISSESSGDNNAGSVTVQASQLSINRQNSRSLTGISSQVNQGSQGNAGQVQVSINDTATILNGGVISSSTFSSGNAGQVSVEAGNLMINRQDSSTFTGISSQANSGSTGDAGRVNVSVSEALKLNDGGAISSSTFSDGRAGSVSIAAQQLLINGSQDQPITGIFSIATQNSSGQAGSVTIQAQDIAITNGGIVNIQSDPLINPTLVSAIEPTEISIQANKMTLDSDATISARSNGNIPASSIIINATKQLTSDNAQITTAANQADGGSITLSGSNVILTNSQVTTSVAGEGDGGDITLTPNVLVLNSGFMQANTAGFNAAGGDIVVDSEVLISSNNQLASGGDTQIEFQPGLNVIQAAAPDGVSGSIDITSPELNISGTLISLDAQLIDIDSLSKNPCANPNLKQSTLTSISKGGLPDTVEQPLSVPVNSRRLQKMLHQRVPDQQNAISPQTKNSFVDAPCI